MSTATADQSAGEKQPGALRVGIQKVGSFMSGMIMPVIPALIAWGILTAVLVNIAEFTTGWQPAEALDTVIGPMIHYLLPILIAVQGGKMVYEMRGAVVGGTATLGVIAGSDYIIDQLNAALPAGEDELGQIHMFIGAMIMGPLAAWIMKKLDALWEGKIRAGFEMLVNMFSAGILGFLLVVAGFFGLAPLINGLMDILEAAVSFLVDNGLLPLASIIIEPAKVFFLNNAINHGVLTPLGAQESSVEGSSILYLLEANPGPGLGILLAFSIFGVGAARATAPGAAVIVFLGGIHEVYFPYVLMKPALLLAVIAGGATGVGTNMVFDSGLVSAAAPGSFIAVMIMTASGSHLGVILSVVLSTAVTFAVASLILLSGRKKDLEGEDKFTSAVAKTEATKGKSSSHLANLAASASGVPAQAGQAIQKVIFACDAGMGSSAMGASVLRKKFKAAGLGDVEVTNKAIAALPGDTDLVITQEALTDRARGQEPEAIHVSVDSFMNAPEYDEVVELVRNSREGGSGAETAEPADAEVASAGEAAASGILTLDQVRIHSGSATQEEALAEAAEILVSAGAVTEDYLQAMKDREATVSTFMGNGLAIPHGTNEAKEAVKASALSVVRYDGGADWAGDQADFVIGIAGVGDEHLEILSAIAQLFADEDEVARLRAASTEQELLQMLSAVNKETA